jgi:hypothetical protein
MVARVTHNPIVKGLRVRNNKITKRINKHGHRKLEKAPPEERLERSCPHLAFFEPSYYDRVVRRVDQRTAKYRRTGKGGVDHRKDVPKKRTDWPGQHLRCAICGRIYHWTGLASKKAMVCSGAHCYQCWNSLVVKGDLICRKLTEAIWQEIQNLSGFDETLVANVRATAQVARNGRTKQREQIQHRLNTISLQIGNVTKAIAEQGTSKALLGKLNDLEAEQEELQQQCQSLHEPLPEEVGLPSLEAMKTRAEELFQCFAASDPEIGRLMRRLIPDLRCYPVRLCDEGPVELRAHFTLHLAPLVTANGIAPELDALLRKEMVVDLFDPPQRVAYREQVVRLRADGMTEREVAHQLGLTITAAQRAMALDRLMKKRGLLDPYVPLQEPPADYGKLRRHMHPRYRFEPLDGQNP